MGPRPIDDMLEILKANCGFDEPERWVEYARKHGFRKVAATLLTACPDCEGQGLTEVGRYVYYSQLMRLQHCRSCDLLFSDVRLNSATIEAHFQRTYKDNAYFETARAGIFGQIRDLMVARFGNKTKILDVGGAKGHLAKILSEAGFSVTVNDLSADACAYARDVFGLSTIVGDLGDLSDCRGRFDVLLLIDVLYCVPELRRAWSVIDKLVAGDGAIILRIPNRLWWMRPWQHALHALGRRRFQTVVRGLNPEHIYVFTNSYLRRRLGSAGFRHIEFIPSVPLAHGRLLRRVLARGLGVACSALFRLTGGRLLLSPSQFVIAER